MAPSTLDAPIRPWRRLLAVGGEGFASGIPYMVGTKLLQGWLTASGVPIGMIGLLSLAELPYTLKLFWAPLLDRWPIPWPDRRRGWLLLLQLLLVGTIAAMALLQPRPDADHLALVGAAALLLAVVSASQDVMVDAYRTDLMPRKSGAAAPPLGPWATGRRCWPWAPAVSCWRATWAGRRPSWGRRRWWQPCCPSPSAPQRWHP
jgi:PAT family beta-lactamase induction signal transducer AmpG